MAINAPGFRPAASPVDTEAYQRTFDRKAAPSKSGRDAKPRMPEKAALPYERSSARWLNESSLHQVGKALSTVVPEITGHISKYLEAERNKKAEELQYELYSMDDQEAKAFYEEQAQLLGPNHRKALKEQFALRMGYSAATKMFAGIKSGQTDLTQTSVDQLLSHHLDPILQEYDDPLIQETIKGQLTDILPKLRTEQQNALAAKQQERAIEGFYGTALSAVQAGLAEDLPPEAIAQRVRGLYGRYGPGTDLNLSNAQMDELVIETAAWAADQGHESLVEELLLKERQGVDGETIPAIAGKRKYREQVDAIRQTAKRRESDRLSEVNQGFLVDLQYRAALGEDIQEDIEANPWIKDVWTPSQIARIKATSQKSRLKMAQEYTKRQVDDELRQRVNTEIETWAAAVAADPSAIWDISDMQVISQTDPTQMKSMEGDELREQIATIALGEATSPGFDPREKPQVTKNAVSWLAQSGYQWEDINDKLETATTLISAKAFVEGKAPDAAKEAMAWYREFKAQGALSALGVDKETKTFYEAVATLEKGQFKGDTDQAMLQVARMKENTTPLTDTSALSDRSEHLQKAVRDVMGTASRSWWQGGQTDVINGQGIKRDIKTSARSLMEMGFSPKQAFKITTDALKGNYMSINGFAFTKGNRAIPPNIETISEYVADEYVASGLGEALGIDDPGDLALVPDTVGGQSVWTLKSKSLGPVVNAGDKKTWELPNGETMELTAGRFTSAQLRVLSEALRQKRIRSIEQAGEDNLISNPMIMNARIPSPEDGQGGDNQLTPEELMVEPSVDTRQQSSDQSVWPLATEGRISSNFGMRMHPIDKVKKMHTGVDIAAPSGTPITAVAGGVVKSAGKRGGYGYMVEIEHPDGHVTRYAHAETLNVKKGQRVMRGDNIATVGSTGKSTGPHLHFEVRSPDGKPVDPLKNMEALQGNQQTSRANTRTSAGNPRLLYAYATPALKSARDLFKERGDPLWKDFDQELKRRGEA
jgi:murein DD-endopeptidase MepM/ murein hydrolase activator NlpD